MLLGRHPECGLIDSLLDTARQGTSGTLVLRGEPGIGKSALLDYARESSKGMLVLSARGVESEAELPVAGLSQLVSGALDRMEAIPTTQRAALESLAQVRVCGQLCRKHLYRDDAIEAGVAGAIDFAHAAGADGRFDLVGTETGTGG